MSGTLLAIVLSFTAAAEEKPAVVLDGTWTGTYEHLLDEKKVAVSFTMTLSQDGEMLTGHITEKNTFGDPKVAMLKAALKGRYNAKTKRVTFTKTYDGTGGVTHAVEYKGKVSRLGRRLEGTWTTDITGTFQAEKSKK